MIANLTKPLKTFYLISLTLIVLLWLEQRSINSYWIQTYHTDSPLIRLEKHLTWQLGKQLATAPENWLNTLQIPINNFNTDIVNLFNQYNYANDQRNELLATKQALSSFPQSLNFHLKQYTTILTLSPPLRSFAQKVTTPQQQESTLIILNPHSRTKTKHILDQIVLHTGDKVFFVGDSLMQGVAPYVMKTLLKEHGIESINLSKQSTGLTYPNFFNWPQKAEETFANTLGITLMIVFMGPNDPWDFPLIRGSRFLKFESPEWEGAYRARIQKLINAATSHHAKVLWLGAPNMKDPRLNEGMIRLDTIYQSQVTISQQYYLPTDAILGMQGNSFTKFINIPNKGNVNLRTEDGIHFTVTGQKRIAAKILSLLSFKESKEPASHD